MMGTSDSDTKGVAGESRIFAIGDVHGCARELRALLKLLPLDDNSTVVFLGDYVDRGPNSREVIDTILELRKKHHVVAVMGNHEEMFLDFLADPYSVKAGLFIYNGGSATLASYADMFGKYAIPAEHIEFLRSLSLYYETDDFFFVHAGVPDKPLDALSSDEDRKDLLWIRKSFFKSDFQWSKTIVHGHTPIAAPELHPHRINVDTGCVFARSLTAIELPSRRLFSVRKPDKIKKVMLSDVSSGRIAVRFDGEIPVRINCDGRDHPFKTVNYSEAGMLLRQIFASEEPLMTDGQVVDGVIGVGSAADIRFRGYVIRAMRSGVSYTYAVQLEASSEMDLPDIGEKLHGH